jgi:hypothetical protein
MTMNGAAHEKAPRTALNKHGATLERPKHSVDACIANGQTQEGVFHTLSDSVGKICSWSESSQSCFYPPAVPLIFLLIKQTCSQIPLPTDSPLPLGRRNTLLDD